MRGWAYLFLSVGFASVVAGPVLAQSTDDPYRRVKVRHGGFTRRPGYASALQNREFRGIRTRIDAIREMDELTKRAADRYRNRLPESPLRKYLQKRNLLAARSPLGRNLTSDLGLRSVEMPGDESVMAEALTLIPSVPTAPANPDEPRKPLRYENLLEARISAMADEYYQKGLHATSSYDPLNRKKNTMLQARSYFDLCIDAEPQRARGYLANTIVCFYNSEPRQAYRYLTDGLKRVKTADDLKIDKQSFFRDSGDFRTMYDKAAQFARNVDADSESAANVMLAFFAHAYGDQTLAATAIEAAAKNPPAELGEAVFQIQDIIKNTSSTSSAPSNDK